MENIISWIENIRTMAQTVGYSIAGLCVICLAIMIIAGGSQGMSKGKNWALGIILGVCLLSFGVGLIATLS